MQNIENYSGRVATVGGPWGLRVSLRELRQMAQVSAQMSQDHMATAFHLRIWGGGLGGGGVNTCITIMMGRAAEEVEELHRLCRAHRLRSIVAEEPRCGRRRSRRSARGIVHRSLRLLLASEAGDSSDSVDGIDHRS